MKGLSLEAKVGLLILASGILLGAFLFILGGVSLEDAYTIYVDFNNPGSVQPGAAVRIGGVKVGSVEEVEYLGQRLDPETGRRALVRMRLSIHSNVQETIHEDATFFVTAQGVLGEQFVAVDPGDFEAPALAPDSIVPGIDPPRLDMALALGYELLEMIVEGVRERREDLTGLLEDVIALVHNLRLLVVDNRGDIDSIIDSVRTLSEESVTTLQSARSAYIDGDQPQRIMRNLDRTVAMVNREAPGLVRDLDQLTGNANELIGTFGPDQRSQMQSALASAERIATQAEGTMGDASQIVTRIQEGRGTVGALLADEEVYDDLQELIRDLKHNPWKFFWRE